MLVCRIKTRSIVAIRYREVRFSAPSCHRKPHYCRLTQVALLHLEEARHRRTIPAITLVLRPDCSDSDHWAGVGPSCPKRVTHCCSSPAPVESKRLRELMWRLAHSLATSLYPELQPHLTTGGGATSVESRLYSITSLGSRVLIDCDARVAVL